MSAKDETIQKNEEDFGMPSDAIETLEQVAQAFGVQPDTVIKERARNKTGIDRI